MNQSIKGVLATAVLVLVSLACRLPTGGGSTSTPLPTETQSNTPFPTETQPGPSKVLLRDDFTSGQWGTGTDADSSIEYVNAALQFIIFTQNWFTWSTPNDSTYQNVHIEVTAINNNTDSTTALGIMCNKQPSKSSFYYFAMTPAGEYAIARATAGEQDVFLTNNDQWASSDLIVGNAPSYRVGADCGNGKLTLYVDGQQIDSVSDTTYTSGGVALFAWSGEEATNTDIAFDDFLMTELP